MREPGWPVEFSNGPESPHDHVSEPFQHGREPEQLVVDDEPGRSLSPFARILERSWHYFGGILIAHGPR